MALNIEERPLSQAASELDLATRQPSHSGLTETAIDGEFRRLFEKPIKAGLATTASAPVALPEKPS